MDTDRSWPQRFMTALPPWSERALALLLLVLTFGMGVAVGVVLSTTREVNRHTRETERLITQIPTRPTLDQRLDAIEQRLQAIEQRLTP